jgi:hypothetical protein
MVGNKALQVPDTQWFILLPPITLILTGMRTYPANYARKGKPLSDEIQGLCISSLCNQSNVSPDIQVDRTGPLTHRRLFYDIIRENVRIKVVYRRTKGMTPAVIVPHIDGTYPDAVLTIVALFFKHAQGTFYNFYPIFPVFLFYPLNVGVGYNLDVGVFFQLFAIKPGKRLCRITRIL